MASTGAPLAMLPMLPMAVVLVAMLDAVAGEGAGGAFTNMLAARMPEAGDGARTGVAANAAGAPSAIRPTLAGTHTSTAPASPRGGNTSLRGASTPSKAANALSKAANASSRAANVSSRATNASSRAMNSSSSATVASPKAANASSKSANTSLWSASAAAAALTAAAAAASSGPPACKGQPNYELARTSWCGEQSEPFACYKELSDPNPIWDCHVQQGQQCSGVLCRWSDATGTPPCDVQPNYDLARSWCGHQTAPFACYKSPSGLNPTWDCHIYEGQQCSVGGSLCTWPRAPPPIMPAPAPLPQPGATRFVTWNLYIFTLPARIYPVAEEIVRMSPDIAALPEMWSEKRAILKRMNELSGPVWATANGGLTERFHDADILFRSDRWEHIDSDTIPYSAARGLNWAALRRKSDGFLLLAAGTHPLCCTSDFDTLLAVEFVTRTLRAVQEKYPFPIALMGDLNSGYDQPSQRLLRDGSAWGFGRSWSIPQSFVDAWAELHPTDPNPSTIQDFPVRLDYVYFQRSPKALGEFPVISSTVWPRAAGSDHRAVSGDVLLTPP